MPSIPGVSHQRAVRALRKAGFTVIRQGKHIVMSDGRRILTIPRANPINALTMGWDRSGRRPHGRRVSEAAMKTLGER